MTVVTVHIRRARAGDAATLTEIAHAAKRHWGYPDELMRLWTADLTVAAELAAAGMVFCAEEGRHVRGFYSLSHEGEVFELEHLFVDPSAMGRGLGAMLFEHAIATVRSMSGTLLRIASDPHAEGFYRRMGAQRVGEVGSTPRGRTLPLLFFDIAQPDDSVA
jgi:GNAT superfamily N-acetyltransferase